MPEEIRPDVRERPALRLSFSQLAAASLATVSGAVAASFLGVYGTIIGTGVMSVVSTVGSVIYQHYLDRTRDRLRTSRIATRTALRAVRADRPDPDRARREEAPAAPGNAADSDRNADGNADRTGETRSADGGDREAEVRTGGDAPRMGDTARRRWRVAAGTAGAAVLVFGFAMGIISVTESLAGKPAASIITGQSGSGTTFGRTVGAQAPENRQVEPSGTPSRGTSVPESPAPSSSPTGAPDQKTAPSPQPAPTTPPTEESVPSTETDEAEPDSDDPGNPPTP